MGPLKVLEAARENANWEPSEDRTAELLKAWHDGNLGTIAPNLLQMYVEDAIPVTQIAKAWKIPAPVIVEMYKKQGLIPYGNTPYREEK